MATAALLREAARRLRAQRARGGFRRRQHQTTATLTDGEWVINGSKVFITNAGHRDLGLRDHHGSHRTNPTAAARSPTSSSPTALPATRSASATARWAGMRPTPDRSASTDCRVPESNLLGRRGGGFRQFMKALEGGRIGVAAMGVGLAQGALDEAIAYAKQRRAFGQPISKFQAIQAKIADISAQLEAARLLTYRAAVKMDRGELFLLAAAQAKLVAGRLAVRATEEAVQIHGGYGFIEEYPVCRFYRDAKILTIGEGTDEVQQMLIAKQLGC